jgi:hypothetical protein
MVVVQFNAGSAVATPKKKIVESATIPQQSIDFETLFRSRLDNIRADLESLCRSAYDLGSSQAAGRFLEFVSGSEGSTNFPLGSPANSGTKRVQRGFTRIFLQKVLGHKPLTIREIRNCAETDAEKAIPYQTIRLELIRGREEKIYKKTTDKDGTDRWYV